MKLGKDRVFASTHGHAVRFVNDEPCYVPPIMVRACDAIGAVLVSEDGKEDLVDQDEIANALTTSFNAAKTAEGISTEPKAQPTVPLDRMAEILKGVRTITDRNKRDEFTAAGHVKLAALGKETGFRVDKSELAEAMDIINDPD